MPYCFVPGCNSGYKSCKEKRHLFKVKQGNNEQLRQWKLLIPRANREFTFKDSICDLHFDQRFIKNTFNHIINGQEVKIERGSWRLTDDAKPTIFPNLPYYFRKKLPSRRTSLRKRKSVLALTDSYNPEVKENSGKNLANSLAKPANDINEKSVIPCELYICETKIKQEKDEEILLSNKQVVPVVEALSVDERKRNFFDSNGNFLIEEYYEAKLEVLNKEYNAKLDAMKAEYEQKIKFLKEQHEYKLAFLKLKMEYKVSKCLK